MNPFSFKLQLGLQLPAGINLELRINNTCALLFRAASSNQGHWHPRGCDGNQSIGGEIVKQLSYYGINRNPVWIKFVCIGIRIQENYGYNIITAGALLDPCKNGLCENVLAQKPADQCWAFLSGLMTTTKGVLRYLLTPWHGACSHLGVKPVYILAWSLLTPGREPAHTWA